MKTLRLPFQLPQTYYVVTPSCSNSEFNLHRLNLVSHILFFSLQTHSAFRE